MSAENIQSSKHPVAWWEMQGRFANLLELLRLYAEAYCRLSHRLGAVSVDLCVDQSDDYRDDLIRETLKHLHEMKAECEALGLDATTDKISHTLETWNKYGNVRGLSLSLAELGVCLQSEFKRRICFIVPRKTQELYEYPQKDWEQILAVFPEATDDVEEMNRCRAFGRDAAAVFHVLLAVEHGVIALGKFVDVPDKKPGWDATCRELEQIVTEGRNKASKNLRRHFAFLELANRDIHSMKMAWRNKVNHAAGRLVVLTSDFKPQVAEKIITACHGFMLLLATEGPNKKRG